MSCHMSSMPSHGHAGSAMVANAHHPGMAGGLVGNAGCLFQAPPAKRCYCMPAAFTSTCGSKHHTLLGAYGNSRPCL